jgi:hypothetical protein
LPLASAIDGTSDKASKVTSSVLMVFLRDG